MSNNSLELIELATEQGQLSYVGVFARPALDLWGHGNEIVSALYSILAPANVSLADMRHDALASVLSEQSVSVNLGNWGTYKFRFDRIEITVYEAYNDMPTALGEILDNTDTWLRSAVKDFGFNLHLATYSGHHSLSKGTAREFLLNFSNIDLQDMGISEGCGIIFHWAIPEKGWRTQFTVEHSFSVTDGLFLQFVIRADIDKIDYQELSDSFQSLFQKALGKSGLRVRER